VRVCPVPEQVFPGDLTEPAAFVFLSSAGTQPVSLRKRLASFYGLTPAEARLAEAIATGGNLVEFCAQQNLSINTGKSHLKNIFAKTGHHRQSQLVRDVLGNPLLQFNLPQPDADVDSAESEPKRRSGP
jgi:DNA-binding CsgD family transcriptional regulator